MPDKNRVITLQALTQILGERSENGRVLVALVGPPGAGKSHLAKQIVDDLYVKNQREAAILPMDGFHFDDLILEARNQRACKGSPETFDVGGLYHMLKRLRSNTEKEIAVPVFDRSLEISRAGARIIPSDVQLLIVEGNYLLLEYPPWSKLSPLFDVTVLIQANEDKLRDRLTERWHENGIVEDEVTAKVEANDLPNGHIVLNRSSPADFILKN